MIKTNKTHRLTNQQAIFVQEIAKGNTQRQACMIAYPNTRNWTKNAVDVRASQLMENQVIRKELQEIANKKNQKALWDREKATKIILDIIEINKKELIMVHDIQYKIIKSKEKKIEELLDVLKNENNTLIKVQLLKEVKKIEKELYKLKIESMANEKNTNSILYGIKILNKMYGLRNLGYENFKENKQIKKIKTVKQLKYIANKIIKSKEQE